MKNVTRSRRLFVLAKETLKQLSTQDLQGAGGGGIRSLDCPDATYYCKVSYPPQCYA